MDQDPRKLGIGEIEEIVANQEKFIAEIKAAKNPDLVKFLILWRRMKREFNTANDATRLATKTRGKEREKLLYQARQANKRGKQVFKEIEIILERHRKEDRYSIDGEQLPS